MAWLTNAEEQRMQAICVLLYVSSGLYIIPTATELQSYLQSYMRGQTFAGTLRTTSDKLILLQNLNQYS
jgi:hypothetical protein